MAQLDLGHQVYHQRVFLFQSTVKVYGNVGSLQTANYSYGLFIARLRRAVREDGKFTARSVITLAPFEEIIRAVTYTGVKRMPVRSRRASPQATLNSLGRLDRHERDANPRALV